MAKGLPSRLLAAASQGLGSNTPFSVAKSTALHLRDTQDSGPVSVRSITTPFPPRRTLAELVTRERSGGCMVKRDFYSCFALFALGECLVSSSSGEMVHHLITESSDLTEVNWGTSECCK